MHISWLRQSNNVRAALAIAAGAIAVLSAIAYITNRPDALVPEPSRAVRTQSDCGSPSAEGYFFSPDQLDPLDRTHDAKVRADYSWYLRGLAQPSLWCGNASGETYRLLRLDPTGSPVSVRVTRTSGSGEITAVELQRPSWKGPGRITRDTHATLSDAQWETATATLAGSGFWNLDTYERRDIHDGAAWILEGRRASAYHIVERTSPGSGPFKDACLMLLRLAGVETPP
jgi:hypothetical protein